MSRLRYVILALILMVLASCRVPLEDNSHENIYSKLMDSEFVTKQQMFLCGITEKVERNATADVYILEFEPGRSGPEVVEEIPVSSGSRFRVVKVLTCPKCTFLHGRETVFAIELTNFSLRVTLPVHQTSLHREGKIIGEDDFLRLNPKYFSAANGD